MPSRFVRLHAYDFVPVPILPLIRAARVSKRWPVRLNL
jgi:hypothetical protein